MFSKRILVSLMVVGVVGAAAAGSGTLALFSDEESSTGNTFTTGDIDLTGDVSSSTTVPDETGLEQTDLESLDTPVFNLQDVKPGDSGSATFTLNVGSNDGYMFMQVDNTDDSEVDSDSTTGGVQCTEPEAEVDSSCTGADDAGELHENLEVRAYIDANGNGVFNDASDTPLVGNYDSNPGTLDEVLWANVQGGPVQALGEYDSQIPDEDDNTWEAGSDTDVVVDWRLPTGAGNDVQLDSATYDVRFAAIQARNVDNPDDPFDS